MHKYDAAMRTTVDLPPSVHRRVSELAANRGQSLSRTVAELTADALARWEEQEDTPFDRDEKTGAPVVRLGRVTTSADVAELWDDE